MVLDEGCLAMLRCLMMCAYFGSNEREQFQCWTSSHSLRVGVDVNGGLWRD